MPDTFPPSRRVHVALSPRVLAETVAVALRDRDLAVATGLGDGTAGRPYAVTITDREETLTGGDVTAAVVVVDGSGRVRWRGGAEHQVQELPSPGGLRQLVALVERLFAEQGRRAGQEELEGGASPRRGGEA